MQKKISKVLVIFISCCFIFVFSGCDSFLMHMWTDISYRYAAVAGGFEIVSYSVNEHFDYSKPVELPSEYNGEKIVGIGEGAFSGGNFINIVLPADLEYINSGAFMSCKELRQVKNNSEKLKKIDSYAFQNCSKLSSFDMPESLTYLGDLVFDNTGLKKASLPKSLVRIGFNCFSNSKIEEIEFKNSVSTVPQATFRNTNIEMLIIPETVQTLGPLSFANNQFLSSVVLSEGVYCIDNNAFSSCPKLEEILIPKSVFSISENSFKNVSESFRIRCYKGSYAEKYAKKNKINFVIIK